MNLMLQILLIALALLVLLLAFLVVGVLRTLGVLSWRLEQIEVTSPRRIGRDGVPVGRSAPEFTLPSAAGDAVSLRGLAGRKLLLVFTQSGCGPCHDMMPELDRAQARGEFQVLVINNGDAAEARHLVEELNPRFPVLIQESFAVSKRYEVFATPFAFLIDERGIILSKGLAGTRQHLDFVLSGAGNRIAKHDAADHRASTVEREPAGSISSEEVSHA